MTSVSSNGSLRANRTGLPTGDFSVLLAGHSQNLANAARALLTLTVSGQQAIEVYSGSFNNTGVDTEFRIWLDATGSDNTIAQAASLGWYWFAIVRSAGVLTVYYKTDAATSWTTLAAGTHSGTTVSLDVFSWNDGTTDGASSTERARCIKIWSAAKSGATLLDEATRSTVGDSSSLWAFYAWASHSALGDSSGNARDFTTTGTGATFAGEPAFSGDSALGVTPSFIPSEERNFSPTIATAAVALLLAFTGSEERNFSPTVAVDLSVAPVFVPSEERTFAPTLATGAVTLAPSFISSEERSFVPSIATGALSLSPAFAASEERIFAPTIAAGYFLLPDFLRSEERSFAPSLATGALALLPSFAPSEERSFALTLAQVAGSTQTTSVDCGHTFGFKRGTATDLGSFRATGEPWGLFLRAQVTDWAQDSPSGYSNIALINADNGSEADTGAAQIYYKVATGELRMWVGEGWPGVPDVLLRAGAYSGFFTIAFTCAGGFSDPVYCRIAYDDENTVHEIALPPGGKLRQIVLGGAISGETSYNLRITTPIVFAAVIDATLLLDQRKSPAPVLTGSNLWAFYNFWNDGRAANLLGVDQGATYGAAGGRDAILFNPEEVTYPSAVPKFYTGPTFVAEGVRSEERTFASNVSLSSDLLLAFVASEERNFAPSLATGAVTLSPAFVSSEERNFAPSLDVGAVSLSPAFVASEERYFALTVGTGYFLLPDFLASEERAFAPALATGAVSLAPSFAPSEERAFSATVDAAIALALAFAPSEERNFAPSLATGAVTLAPSFAPSEERTFAPSLDVGAVGVSPNFIPSEERNFAPSMLVGYFVLPAFVPSEERPLSLAVSPGAVTIIPNFTPSEERAFDAIVSGGLRPGRPRGSLVTQARPRASIFVNPKPTGKLS